MLGYSRAKTPLERNLQTLAHHDCPRWEGFPPGEQGQTRTQPTQSTPNQIPLRPWPSVPQVYQAEETSAPTGRGHSVSHRYPLSRHVHEIACMDTPYLIIKNANQHQQANSSLNIYLFIAPTRWPQKPKSNYFKSQTKFPTMHSLSAKTHGNSNYYGQLKSIENSGDYSQRQIKSDNVR